MALGYPFAGKSGWSLNGWLASAGLSRAQVFTGNVCQMRPSPTSNEFHLLEWHGAQVQEGIAALREDLARFRPNCVLALGNAALHLLRHGNVAPPKSKKLQLFQWSSHIGTWRGSLFLGARSFDPFETSELRMKEATRGLPENGSPALFCPPLHDGLASTSCAKREAPFRQADATQPERTILERQPQLHGVPACVVQNSGMPLESKPDLGTVGETPLNRSSYPVAGSLSTFKCLSTYHPAATFRDPSFTYPLVSDLKRAVAEARTPVLDLTQRNIVWGLSADEVETRCAAIRTARQAVAFDIEGGLGGLQCLSFATSPSEAFVVDLMGECLERPRLLRAITSVLEDPAVPKVCWNAAYERAILQATHSVVLKCYEDGMLAWWEKFSELPKGLDFVASLLTREPYWAEGIGWDRKTGAPKVTGPPFWRYNGTDSCVTLEIWQHPLIQAVSNSRTPVAFAL